MAVWLVPAPLLLVLKDVDLSISSSLSLFLLLEKDSRGLKPELTELKWCFGGEFYIPLEYYNLVGLVIFLEGDEYLTAYYFGGE
jgi:hypothetical protein